MDTTNKPVAWMSNGSFEISTMQSDKFSIPLYTHPVKELMMVLDGNRVYSVFKELTDEEIKEFIATFPIIFTPDDLCTFARAILRKAQEK